jgi:hypothetical protein
LDDLDDAYDEDLDKEGSQEEEEGEAGMAGGVMPQGPDMGAMAPPPPMPGGM